MPPPKSIDELRIPFQVLGTKDGADDWEDDADRYVVINGGMCSVSASSASEPLIADGQTTIKPFEVWTVYRTDIKPTNRIKLRGVVLSVRDVDNYELRNEWLKLVLFKRGKTVL